MQVCKDELNFEAISELGSGAFGRVLLVKVREDESDDNKENKPVNDSGQTKSCLYAYKKLSFFNNFKFSVAKSNTEMLNSVRKNYTNVSREIQLLSRCDHENIIKLKYYSLPDWEEVKAVSNSILGEAGRRAKMIEKQSKVRCRRMKVKDTSAQINKIVNKRINIFLDEKVETNSKITTELFTEFTANSYSIDKFSKKTIKGCLTKTIFRVIQKVLTGLCFLHNVAKIVHRDIKPANVVITLEPELTVKIIDFGLARDLNEEHKIKSAGGSTYYQAPETFVSRPTKISEKIDVWGVGCVLR